MFVGSVRSQAEQPDGCGTGGIVEITRTDVAGRLDQHRDQPVDGRRTGRAAQPGHHGAEIGSQTGHVGEQHATPAARGQLVAGVEHRGVAATGGQCVGPLGC